MPLWLHNEIELTLGGHNKVSYNALFSRRTPFTSVWSKLVLGIASVRKTLCEGKCSPPDDLNLPQVMLSKRKNFIHLISALTVVSHLKSTYLTHFTFTVTQV